MRPLIGITMWVAPHDDQRTYPTPYTFEFLHRSYGFMLRRAGGVPILLPNASDPEEVRPLLGTLDGLLLAGGEDVDPRRYEEDVRTTTLKLTPDRDEFELLAIKRADELGLPILGICRGLQTLNVACGGTLFQDLREQREQPTHDHTRGGLFYHKFHEVNISKGTRLHEILGRDTIRISTSHHQAVKDVARALRVNAHSAADQVIEGIEMPGRRFVLAVQWHPEVMPADDMNTKRLAEAFVAACRKG